MKRCISFSKSSAISSGGEREGVSFASTLEVPVKDRTVGEKRDFTWSGSN